MLYVSLIVLLLSIVNSQVIPGVDFTNPLVNTFPAGQLSTELGLDSEPRVNWACVIDADLCPIITGDELAAYIAAGQEEFGAETYLAWERPCQPIEDIGSSFQVRVAVDNFQPSDDEDAFDTINLASLTIGLGGILPSVLWHAAEGKVASEFIAEADIIAAIGASNLFTWDRDIRVDPVDWVDLNVANELVAPAWTERIIIEMGYYWATSTVYMKLLDGDLNQLTRYDGTDASWELDTSALFPPGIFNYAYDPNCEYCLYVVAQSFTAMEIEVLEEACNCPDFDPDCTIDTCEPSDVADEDCWSTCKSETSCEFDADVSCLDVCSDLDGPYGCPLNCEPDCAECAYDNCREMPGSNGFGQCTANECTFDADTGEIIPGNENCANIIACQQENCYGNTCNTCGSTPTPTCNCNIPLCSCDGDCPDYEEDCITLCEEDPECIECCENAGDDCENPPTDDDGSTDDDSTDDDSTDDDGVEECPEGCGCDGKVNYLRLRNNDDESHHFKITEKKGYVTIFSGDVDSNGEFDVSCDGMNCDNQNTLGTQINIYVDMKLCGSIHTSCSQPIWIGQLVDLCNGEVEIEIVAGSSRNTDTLCNSDSCDGSDDGKGGWKNDDNKDTGSHKWTGWKSSGDTQTYNYNHDSTKSLNSKMVVPQAKTGSVQYNGGHTNKDSGSGSNDESSSVDCPDCICDGKVKKLTFKYKGSSCVDITIKSNKESSHRRMIDMSQFDPKVAELITNFQSKIHNNNNRKLLTYGHKGRYNKGSKWNDGITFYSKRVCPWETFTIDGSGKVCDKYDTLGDEITVVLGDGRTVKIRTNCDDDIWIGEEFLDGDLVIIGGESKNNGQLCTSKTDGYGNCDANPDEETDTTVEEEFVPSTTTPQPTEPEEPFLECLPPCTQDYVACLELCYGEEYGDANSASEDCLDCCQDAKDFCEGIEPVCDPYYWTESANARLSNSNSMFSGTSGAVVLTIVPILIVILFVAFGIKYCVSKKKQETMSVEMSKMNDPRIKNLHKKSVTNNDNKNENDTLESEDEASIRYRESTTLAEIPTLGDMSLNNDNTLPIVDEDNDNSNEVNADSENEE
jgi:hypothetical protein